MTESEVGSTTTTPVAQPGGHRLVVVSNRLPVALTRADGGGWHSKPAAGGLVTALRPVLERRGGVWVGWPGVPASERGGIKAHLRSIAKDTPYSYAPVAVTHNEMRGYYHGFSNEILWPLFHDFVRSCVFEPDYWRSYVAVNRKFARATVAELGEDDFVWVHDYHLMNVAKELRALGVRNRIGLFLHIPFPSPDIFRKLPWRRDLLESLADFDQVGFQTPRDRDNFLACATSLLPGATLSTGGPDMRVAIRQPGDSQSRSEAEERAAHELRVGSYPISIDFRCFAERAAGERVESLSAYLHEQAGKRRIVLGVDRLDYSKGLPYKLAAFRKALSRHRTLRKRVILVQHVVPSRENVPEYQRLRLEIERMVGEINGEFSTPGWVPVHYFYHTMDPIELSAYYRSADIALITPLKDGMNLVAKEYCACRIHDDGVLILSEFAGAAGELGAGALVVNPFDVDAVADRILRAFLMEPFEQRRRMSRMRRAIRENDVYHWVETCLELAEDAAGPAAGKAQPLAGLELAPDAAAPPDARADRPPQARRHSA